MNFIIIYLAVSEKWFIFAIEKVQICYDIIIILIPNIKELMKQLRFLISVVVLALLPLANAWADFYTDPSYNIVYEYEPGSGVAKVATGTRYESDILPQVYVHKNQIGDIANIVEEFVVNGEKYTVNGIGFAAFAFLTNIKTVFIPKTIRYISETAFLGCTGVTDVYCYANPHKLEWDVYTSDYSTVFKPNRGTNFQVLKGYADAYVNKFMNQNVYFIGTLDGEIEEDEGTYVSDFVGYDEASYTIIASESDKNWQLGIPSDGTRMSFDGTSYWGQSCVYFRLGGGTSSIKRFDFTSAFPVKGKMKRITVRAGGGIHHLEYRMPDGSSLESEYVTAYDYMPLQLNFGEGINVSGPVHFALYSATPLVVQSITIELEVNEAIGSKSTFVEWNESPAMAGVDKNGFMIAEEGTNWIGVVDNDAVNVEYALIGGDGLTYGTGSIVAFGQNDMFNFNMIKDYEYSGKVKKIVLYAAGNIYGISAVITDKDGSKSQVASIDTQPVEDFQDYVLNCNDSYDYENADIQIQIHAMSPIFIHSVNVVAEEAVEKLPSGKCGDNLNWELVYMEGVTTTNHDTNEQIPGMKLVITGSGDMYDFTDEYATPKNVAPWMEYRYNIVDVEMSDDITYIGNEAFPRLWNAPFSTLPASLVSVGVDAFYNDMFQNDLYLPANLESIGAYAFSSLNNVKRVHVNSSLSSIGRGGLNGMYGVEDYRVDAANQNYGGEGYCLIDLRTNEVIAGGKFSEIPDGITKIGDLSFRSVRRETIDIPNSVKEIGYEAFYYSNLTEVTIPDGVEVIGQEAFASCQQLLTVTIGKGVKYIRKSPFGYSKNILDVYCYANVDDLDWETTSYENSSFMPDAATRMHVHAADLEKWQSKFNGLNVTYVGDLGSGINVITNNTTVDVAALKGEDLTDNTVDNIYYNLNENRGCGYINDQLVIGQTTDMSQIGNGEPGSDEVRENFNGIILKVNGKGTVTIDSRVFGNKIRLAVRIGNGTPTYAAENSRWQTYISYNVTEETYIYIYAVGPGALLRAQDNRAPEEGDDAIVIYGITVTPDDAEAINDLNNDSMANEQWYDINGRAVANPRQRGIYIRNGKKVMIK